MKGVTNDNPVANPMTSISEKENFKNQNAVKRVGSTLKKWPSTGDLVVCTVRNVKDFGAFVALDEYGNKEGLIHISEVASGWIKYIRDHVREGQKVVCRVLNVNPEREHIDLSLKDVNEHQRRERIKLWKNECKARKWLGFAFNEAEIEGIEDKLTQYGGLYPTFEESVRTGKEVLLKAGMDDKTAEKIQKIASANIKIPEVNISGYVELTCPKPDGVEFIKKALSAAVSKNEIKVTYIGAPRYRISVTASDYKKAENTLKKSAEAAIKFIEKCDGEGKFIRK